MIIVTELLDDKIMYIATILEADYYGIEIISLSDEIRKI